MSVTIEGILEGLDFGQPDWLDFLKERLAGVKETHQREKVETEAECFELTEQLQSIQQRFVEVSNNNGQLQSRLNCLEAERTAAVEKLNDLQKDHGRCLTERAEITRNCSSLNEDKKELNSLLERKFEEIQRLQDELKDVKNELKEVLLQKCQFQVRIGELNSQEVELQYRENKWQQEKQLLTTECDWYKEELRKKEQQILTGRQALSSTELRLNNSIRQRDEELESVRLAKESADDQVALLTSQLEELSEELKNCSNAKLRTSEQYERELECQAKLVELHKNASEVSNSKVMELADALEKLQELFDETKDNHEMLQNKIESIQAESACLLEEKESIIKDLQIELDKANSLLSSNSRGHLTDDEINSLSPSAATASKFIKSRFSLTQIYKDHCNTLEELEVVKAENVRVKKYLEDIVKDIESKAFKIKQQREEYMRSLEMNENFKRQLADADKEIQQSLSVRDSLQRQLTYTRTELERYQRENGNLSTQVRELLVTIEKYRMRDLPDVLSSQLLQEDVLLFRNVEELQIRNQQLLTSLAEAEANRDEIIRSTQSAEVQSLKDELQICLKQLEDLKTLREKQNEVINAISKQRDSYKQLYADSPSRHSRSNLSLNDSAGLEDSLKPISGDLQALQQSMAKLSKDFDIYRHEKTETEKIMSGKMQDLQNANRELISINTKLNGEIEYERQRFKAIQGTLETRSKTITQLQERSHNYGCTIAKHETTISMMTQELMSAKDELARLRVENVRFRDEINTAKSNEQRLHDENVRLRQDTRRHDTLSLTLQEIQARFERKEAEQTLEMRQKIESLNREKQSLEKTLQKITEQHNDYIRGYKDSIQSLQIQADDRERKLQLQTEELEFTKKRLAESQTKANSLETQISVMSGSHRELAVERFQKESQQLQGRLNYLTLQHEELLQKNKEMSAQLSRAKAEEDQFKRLAETLEATMKSNAEAEVAKVAQLTGEINSLAAQLKVKEDLIGEMTCRHKSLEEAKAQLKEQFDKQTVMDNYQIASLQRDLNNEKAKVADLERSRQECIEERDSLREDAKAWESQYQQEVEAHEVDLGEFQAATEEKSALQQRLAESEVTLNEVVESRDRLQEVLNDRDNLLTTENQRMNDRVRLIESENERLLDEVQKLANQIVLNERISRGTADAAVEQTGAENTAEMSTASTESLAEIISYLREERRLATQRAAEAVEEASRATRRAEVVERERNQLDRKLSEAMEEMTVLTAAVSEKAALVDKLQLMETIQAHNAELSNQLAEYEPQLRALEQLMSDAQQNLISCQNEKFQLQSELDNAKTELSASAHEISICQQRYEDLLAQRSDTEAQELIRLQSELVEMQEKLDAVSMDLRSEREKSGVIEAFNRDMSEVAESHKEKLQKFEQLSREHEELNAKLLDTTSRLSRAIAAGRKYREQSQELAQKLQAMETSAAQRAVPLTEEPTSTASSGQVEALMNENRSLNDQLNELRTTSIDYSEGREMRDAELQSLKERIEQLEADKITLETQVKSAHEGLGNLGREKVDAENKLEEVNGRLIALTSMHNSCGQRIKSLQDKEESFQLQMAQMASNYEKQLAELRTQQGKPTLVQPYVQSPSPRMPTASLRLTSGQGRGGKLLRGTPPQASIRPIAESQRLPHVTPTASVRPTPMVGQKTRASVAPTTSLSPGPFAVPDQSSSSTSVSSLFQQVSTAPNVVSTSHHVANVPQAVVSPRVEGEAVEADTNGGGVISSSSAASSAVFAADTAASSSSTDDGSRKRSGERDVSSFSKKFRSGSPELVTTSDDQLRSQIMPDSDVQPDVAYEQLVQSSQADSYDDHDDLVIIEDEPDSAAQDRQAAEIGFEDIAQAPSVGRFALPDTVHPDEGDDGIVPSTPTLFNARSTAPEINSPHVPTSRFTFSSGADSNESVAIVSSDGGFESVIQRSVPSTFGSRSPDQTGGEADSHSAEGQPIDTTGSYADYIQLESDETEEVEESSEAMASGREERDDFIDLDEDSNGASTSQRRNPLAGVKIRRRPIVWSEGGAAGSSSEAGGSDVGSSSQPTATRGRGRGKILKTRRPL